MNKDQIIAITRAVTNKFSNDKNLEVSINEEGSICIKNKKSEKNLLFSMYYAPKDMVIQNDDFIFTEISKGDILLSSRALNLNSYEKVYEEEWYIILSEEIKKDINIALGIETKETSI